MKKPKLRNMLGPIDFSPVSIEAIEAAKKIAQKFGATIRLAHVHHQQYAAGYLGPVLVSGEPIVSFEEHRRETLGNELKKVARRAGLPPSTPLHVCVGPSVFHEICRLAQKIPADLIVMSTHGRTGLQHFFLGSTAERIVQHSPCPVLVTRARSEKPDQSAIQKLRPGARESILVPVDYSSASGQALQYAIGFAAHTGAKLLILHATHLGNGLTVEDLKAFRFAKARKEARAEAQRQMGKFLRPVRFGSVEFDTLLRMGNPVAEICEVAEQHDIDCIITATHGLTGFDHLLMGSVAEQIVRRAPRPVLVVPANPKGRLEALSRLVRPDRSAKVAKPKQDRAGRVNRRQKMAPL